MNTTDTQDGWVISYSGHSHARRPNRSFNNLYFRGLVVLTAPNGQDQSLEHCKHQHRTSQAADVCALKMASKTGLVRSQVCRSCQSSVRGERGYARMVLHWEPYSHKNQDAIDHGPLVCLDCVRKSVDACLDALNNAQVIGVGVRS